MSQIVATHRDLRIEEFSSHFEIEHIPTGAYRGMSDGVDWFNCDCTDPDACVHPQPFTPAWYALIQADLEADYASYLDAYFPAVSPA